jgi:hypothetical protein
LSLIEILTRYNESESEKDIFKYHQEIKSSFLIKDRIAILMSTLTDSKNENILLNKDEEGNKERIYLIMKILLNLLKIPDGKKGINTPSSIKSNMQEDLIMQYSNESVLDTILYVSQNIVEAKFVELIIEFNYNILKVESVEKIIKKKDKNNLNDLLNSEKRTSGSTTSRHSRFGGLYSIKLNEEDKIVSNSMKNIKNQDVDVKKRFDRRKLIKREDLKINFNDNILNSINTYSEYFMKNSFNNLMEKAISMIDRREKKEIGLIFEKEENIKNKTEKMKEEIDEGNKYEYYLLFSIQYFFEYNYLYNEIKNKNKFDVSYLSNILNDEIFQFIYSKLGN